MFVLDALLGQGGSWREVSTCSAVTIGFELWVRTDAVMPSGYQHGEEVNPVLPSLPPAPHKQLYAHDGDETKGECKRDETLNYMYV